MELSNTSTYEQIFKQKALDISGTIKLTRKLAYKALAEVQESQAKLVNKHQKDI